MAIELDSISYIAYAVMIFLGIMVIFSFFLGGLTQINHNIEATQTEDYRKAIVLENILSLDADTEDLYGYEYTQRRGVIPVEYFSNYNPGPNGIGYNVFRRTDHCYIEEVEGLDGQNFAFGIRILENEAVDPQGNGLGDANEDFKSVTVNGTNNQATRSKCISMHPAVRQRAVVSTALLVRNDKNHSKLPVRIYVYDPYPTS
ncbi:hypothetical protein [Candidatus Nanohalovita haloferacivicina]|uniref:hypothetical protein n=1 Tax=Candidatus Nanohalovita haloferacivicina TaxID=2978046 RepID=UPI00325FD66B|nr:hypothetical protein HBNXNv_1072 [Candidatus Nanohalobia archaeon BNXNv]